jgi:L-ascorbate metabolism protein UlaG (beta-lactamase superfamily)
MKRRPSFAAFCLICVYLCSSVANFSSAAEAKELSLRWYGQSFFVLTTSAGTRVAFDPHAIEQFGRPKAEADLVLISHPHPDHVRLDSITNAAKAKVIQGIKAQPPAAEGAPPRLNWNPVDETFKDVKIRNVGVYHDTAQGMLRGKNSIFILEVDGLKIVHLGDLGHLLSEDQVRQIGPVDVLMIPVGGVYTINGSKAKEVMAQLKPRMYVLPMHYGTRTFEDLLPPDEFLEGQANVQRMLTTNELKIRTDFRPPAPVIVLLGWEKGKK